MTLCFWCPFCVWLSEKHMHKKSRNVRDSEILFNIEFMLLQCFQLLIQKSSRFPACIFVSIQTFFLYKHSVCEAQKPLQTKHTLGILSVWRSKDQKKVCCMPRISSFCKWRKTWKNIDYSQTCWREQLKHLLHIFNVKSTQQLLQTKENLEPVKHGVVASYSEINKHSLKWTWPLKMHNSISTVFSETTVYMYQYTVLKL